MLLIFCLVGRAPNFAAPTPAQPSPPWASVYFSDPNAPGTEFLEGGPDEALQAAIESARLSIDAALYDLNLYNVRDALIEAQERSVQVRLVLEGDNFEEEELRLLSAAGIQIVLDGRSDSMHNKFLVIDRYLVWTGSMNFTISDAYGNRNNAILLRSTQLAGNYLAEFEEMFVQHAFGPSSPRNTPHPQLSIDGNLVETYFSPEDETIRRLVQLVNEADESVYFLAFSFTSDELAAALLAAQARGVEIQGVMDAGQAAGNMGGEYQNFLANRMAVRLNGEGGSLHHKLLIIDSEIVVTGSYNFSAGAEDSNDENTLILHSSDLARLYLEEFQRIWELAKP